MSRIIMTTSSYLVLPVDPTKLLPLRLPSLVVHTHIPHVRHTLNPRLPLNGDHLSPGLPQEHFCST